MELVYLWVEEYKNIKNQGFNFSPRFEFHYDKDSKKLTKVRDESTTYKSIFPNNINITAIVGENGSGKSSLFEVLSKILTLNSGLEVFNYFYILNNSSKNICYTNNINILNTDITMEKSIPRQLVDGKLSRGITNHNIALKKYFDVSYLNISHLERNGIIKNDSPDPEDPIKYYGIYRKNDFDLYKENNLYPTFSGFKLSQFNFFQTFAIGNLLVEDKYKKLFFEVFKIKQPYSIKINYQKEELEKIKISNTPNDEPSRLVDESLPKKIETILKFLIKINNNLIIESDDYKTFFELVSSVYNLETNFRLTFQSKDGKDIKLSSGEKTILFYLERIDFMLSQFESKSNIVLFDEIELYLHPNWQKKILKIILDFIQENKLKNNLHIILASHSPFILSDIPKQNVIFLKNGKVENPDITQTFGANIHTLLSNGFFMSEGLMGEFAKSKITEIKDFYEKVKKSKNPKKAHLKKYNDKKKDFENIQRIIGEPFLQTIIKNYLDELEEIFDDETYKNRKKEELLKQFSKEELQKYLDEKK